MAEDLNIKGDEELMVYYQEGNEKAFEILYGRHSQKIYGYLKNHLRNPSFADDVFQATFLKLHSSRLRYDPAFPFLPWLFTICKSVMIDQIRKKERTKEDHNSIALELAQAEAPAMAVSLPSLLELPEIQQQAITLRYQQDLSFEEIAKKLETSPSNARQLLSRAIQKLKKSAGKGDKEDA